MGGVMRRVLEQPMQYNATCLEWKPLLVWIRFDEFHDYHAEYALAPHPDGCQKRIAGSCHELLVVYIRSKDTTRNKPNTIYRRLLKLARDPEEDNEHHFKVERKVSQYLRDMALCVNSSFASRHSVVIWPVETCQLEYKGEKKWATLQPPFLPRLETNNIFVKIEPNSGSPCVDDPVVGRYQHLFAAITRGLDLVRDWQGYGVSQSVFLSVCDEYAVTHEAVSQLGEKGVRGSLRLQQQTRVLVVIDPVLTTVGAHFENNNPTDFGLKAIDEWKDNHCCVRCRCKYFGLKSVNVTEENREGMLFGIADPDQEFFDRERMAELPGVMRRIRRCRRKLGIWCGDDQDDSTDEEENGEEEEEEKDD